MTIMVIALGLGVLHMLFGQCVHIYMEARDGRLLDGILDVVPWWIVFAGIALAALQGSAVVVLVGFLALLFTQGRHKKGIVRKLLGGLASWYDITSWLGDILSYCRLMALMLATSVISQVFNILATLPGEGLPKPVGILVFLVIFWWEISLTWASTSLGPMFMRPACSIWSFSVSFIRRAVFPLIP